MNVVIIGGIAAGITVANRLRRYNDKIEITIIEKSFNLGESTCFLPYAIFSDLEDIDLSIGNIAAYERNNNISIKLMSEVIEIDTDKKELKLISTDTNNIYNLNYDKLVIATGTGFKKLDVLNNISSNIFILKNIVNLNRLKTYIKKNEPKSVTIVGGGVLGLELARYIL